MGKVRMVLAAGTMIGFMAGAGTARADHKPEAFTKASYATTSHADWMSWIPDSTRINKLTLPGTHDTVSTYGGRATETQGFCGDERADDNFKKGCDVTEQLKAGIRSFDLRLACQRNGKGEAYIRAFHGSVFQNIRFNAIVGKTQAFLDAHPSETVLMKVTHATASGDDLTKAPSNCDRSVSEFQTTLRKQYYDSTAYRFWKGTSVNSKSAAWPTMGEARNKMILVVNYANGPTDTINRDQNKDIYTTGDHYKVCIAGDKCSNNTWNNSGIEKTISIDQKQKEISAHINAAQNVANAGNLRDTAISAASFAFPDDYASGNDMKGDGFNQWALDQLWKQETIVSAGIVSADYPGAALIDTLILKNLAHAQPLMAGRPYSQTLLGDFQTAIGHLGRQVDRRVESKGEHTTARGAQIFTGFLDKLVPPAAPGFSQPVFEVVSFRFGAAALSYPNLAGVVTSGGHLDYLVLLIDRASDSITEADLANAFNSTQASLSGNQQERAQAMHAELQRRYPGLPFAVVTTKRPKNKPFNKDFAGRGELVTTVSGGDDDGYSYKLLAWSSPAVGKPTSTTMTCAPVSVASGSKTSCNVRVKDESTPFFNVPTGTVSFSSSGAGDTAPPPCALTPVPNSDHSAQCDVEFTIGTPAGTRQLTAGYAGDDQHAGSVGQIAVTSR